MFEEPVIGLDQAAGELQWRHARGQWSVTVSGLRFANADTQGELQASWRTGDSPARRFPGAQAAHIAAVGQVAQVGEGGEAGAVVVDRRAEPLLVQLDELGIRVLPPKT